MALGALQSNLLVDAGVGHMGCYRLPLPRVPVLDNLLTDVPCVGFECSGRYRRTSLGDSADRTGSETHRQSVD